MPNILTAHQSQAYGGYLGLYDKIQKGNVFCLFDIAQFTPKDFISRNRIRTKDGWQWLTIPTLNKGCQDGLRIADTLIDNRSPWKRKHWRSIQQSYGKAPYFEQYEGFFSDLFSQEWEYLSDFNETVLRWAVSALKIDVKIVKSIDYDFQGKKSDLVLDMARQLGASEYWFGCLGRDYADVESFERAGIKVRFQDYSHPRYDQVYQGFEPYMCVLDAIFCIGEEGTKRMLLMGDNNAGDNSLQGAKSTIAQEKHPST